MNSSKLSTGLGRFENLSKSDVDFDILHLFIDIHKNKLSTGLGRFENLSKSDIDFDILYFYGYSQKFRAADITSFCIV